ncbi:hypothetical protein WJX74_008005 [Apatococcus lobatus]|uniref:Uncharacterized protein n=1 Tax=Apatococcus lobatus TaxID=904363 RepID=A0AAW1RHU2_9CHLO
MGSDLRTIHLLPCTIQHNGAARVSEYFLPKVADPTDSSKGLEATLRGRQLYGAELKLPSGYHCHVVQQQQQQQPEQQSGSQPSLPWTSTAQAATITHWKHDMLPSKTDDLPRCCEWLTLSEQIAADISWQEVEAELAAQDKPPAP